MSTPAMSTHGDLRVWAPNAEVVEVEFADGTGAVHPMRAEDSGWWSWPGPVPDADYAFILDGTTPALPDPRSAHQPHGVHGPSRRFDPASLTWTDADWPGPRDGAGTLGALIYELHVGTFTPEGTFAAAQAQLGYLADLGVDVIELMPVASVDGRWNWGYDGVGLWAVSDAYGGPAGLASFVDAAHAAGMGVALDVVYNHLGASGNYLPRFGPYLSEENRTPWGPAINLDGEGSGEVRAFIIDSALRWLRDFHLDALRLDAVHAFIDHSPRHLLAELSEAVRNLATNLGRPLDLIAESDLNDTSMLLAEADGGWGIDAAWDDDIHHALHVTLTGEQQGYYRDFAGGTQTMPDGDSFDVLVKVLTHAYLHDGTVSTFRGREWGAPIDRAGLDARRLIAYLQDHDQVGNRAAGDRISASVEPAVQAVGAAVVLLGPWTPMIFMGEEWGAGTPWQFFTDFTDPQLAAAVSEGRAQEFASHGWSPEQFPDPQDPRTRDASVLRWSETAEPDHARLLSWYRTCAHARRVLLGAAPTHFANVEVEADHRARTIILIHRPSDRPPYAIVAALAPGEARIQLPGEAMVLASWSDVSVTGGSVVLPGPSVAVFALV